MCFIIDNKNASLNAWERSPLHLGICAVRPLLFPFGTTSQAMAKAENGKGGERLHSEWAGKTYGVFPS